MLLTVLQGMQKKYYGKTVKRRKTQGSIINVEGQEAEPDHSIYYRTFF